MKAMVTGGAGFLGRYLVRELVKNDIETVVYDKDLSAGSRFNGLDQNVRLVEGDVLDLENLTKSMEGCDIVFHTAAIADIDEARTKPLQTM
ncbi:MAG: NAD-dependent epimerase/dehydratase family protein, partial [Methanomicrobiales archaeon]